MIDKKSASDEWRVAVFFYGSFIRKEIMALGGLIPQHIEVARLHGYTITFSPHARIYRSDEHSVYGILVDATHEELEKLYARDGVGLFLPEAIIVEDQEHRLKPALCYISPGKEARPADVDYVHKIVQAATGYSFPETYIRHLNLFTS